MTPPASLDAACSRPAVHGLQKKKKKKMWLPLPPFSSLKGYEKGMGDHVLVAVEQVTSYGLVCTQPSAIALRQRLLP